MNKFKKEVFISALDIEKRVVEIASQINADYQGQSLLVIGVLKGSFIFLADLIRKLSLPMTVEFLSVASYSGTKTTGQVRINLDVAHDIAGKDVLLVEDIIDTGLTIDTLLELLKAKGARSIRICTLLSKPKKHKLKQAIDYVGFAIEDEFVIGYGLDLDGAYRELPYIARVLI